MFTKFLIQSKLVSNDSSYLKWEWNPFMPRFWKQKTIITNFECTYSNINSEYGVDIKKVVNSCYKWNKKDDFDLSLEVGNIFNPISYYERSFIENNGNVTPNSAVTYELQKCYPVTSFEIQNQVIGKEKHPSFITQKSTLLTPNPIPFKNDTYNINSDDDKYSHTNPLINIFNSTPKYMLNSPLLPTPEHFKNIDFSKVVASGYNLSPEEITRKGKILSYSIWLILFCFVLAFFVFLIALTNTIFSVMSNTSGFFSFFLTTLYSFGFMIFLFVNFIVYSHIYWQYSNNRFSSLHDYIKDIAKSPQLILPMRTRN